MFTVRAAAAGISLATLFLCADMASGQNYPTRPIRIYTGSIGGTTDTISRLIANGITSPLGQPIVVENRGSARVSQEAVANSPPDGYNLVVAGDLIWVGPLLLGNPDGIKEFAPISLLGSTPNVLAVHPSLPVKSVKELIALAKARPGDLNYSSTSIGSSSHIATELFMRMTGIKLVRIEYTGNDPALGGIVRGETQLMFSGANALAPYIQSGRVRALAVTSERPSVLAVGLPTMAASGLPGYPDMGQTSSLYAPAKTPAAIITRLNQEVVRLLKTKEAQTRYMATGAEVVASSPEELDAWIKTRIAIVGKLVKDVGIKVQ